MNEREDDDVTSTPTDWGEIADHARAGDVVARALIRQERVREAETEAREIAHEIRANVPEEDQTRVSELIAQGVTLSVEAARRIAKTEREDEPSPARGDEAPRKPATSTARPSLNRSPTTIKLSDWQTRVDKMHKAEDWEGLEKLDRAEADGKFRIVPD